MIYVSLTTIPKRIENIKKSVDSLLEQTVKPDKIYINIPKKYKRFKEVVEENHIPKFEKNIVEVTRCEDFGPGTKLLGSLEKFEKNSLVILADDDHIYENYMIEKFNHFYSLAPDNAYSFYVHPLKNFGVGQGADGFAINTNYLDGVEKFYNEVVKENEDIYIHDDLWTSFFLFYVKKIKILSLQSHIKKSDIDKFPLIYKKHINDNGLITNYGTNINEAIQKRDQIALKSVKYMFDKIKYLKF